MAKQKFEIEVERPDEAEPWSTDDFRESANFGIGDDGSVITSIKEIK